VEFVFIDLEEAEDRYGLEPAAGLTPEKIFDARWAMVLLGEAMNRLSHQYMAQGKATTFQALRTFLGQLAEEYLRSRHCLKSRSGRRHLLTSFRQRHTS
jgi:hypothetical protein